MARLIKCKTCGVEIASSAKSCPGCGAKNKKPIYTKWWFWVVLLFVIPAVNPASSSDTAPSIETSVDTPTTDDAEQNKVVATVGERAALDKANSYLSMMYFSKKGLKNQLEFEGFTSTEIYYAIDSISVDWLEQALGKGNEYMDTMSFSKVGLKDQLLFEGFTDEQATYAVDKIFG